jgi:acyl-CoA synthetase (AMP-forming)/AMP-acid ligase II
LQKQGIEPNDRLAICLKNCHQYVLLAIACQLIGADAVGFNFRAASEDIIQYVNDCEADMFVFGETVADDVIEVEKPNLTLKRTTM